MSSNICPECGNMHYGPCATEETCFTWMPETKQIPNEVLISGSWHKWQTFQKLTKQTRQNGEVYFKIILTLLAGKYQYKYLVDGQWKHNHKAPTVKDPFGTCNNTLKVYPKKIYQSLNKDGTIKISSGMIIEGLKLIGSWDNWQTQISMIKNYNNLRACDQYVAYVDVEPDMEYQFKFKLNKQYLIDQKFPTVLNNLNTLNNIIITYAEQDNATPQKRDTPTKYWNHRQNTPIRDFNCKTFEWVTITRQFALPYDKVVGHTMCSIGQFIYIFGGYCRSQFYNSMTKVNSQFKNACTQDAFPNGRAFQNMVTYGNKIIIYGGHNKAVLQDYYSFNVSEEKWVAVPNISGKYPYKKQKCSCVIYEMLLVFFGGYVCSPDVEYQACFKQISVLDIQNMKWIDVIEVKGEQPLGRFAHTASLIGSDMYIFGGTCSAAENLNLNDIWKINLQKVSELTWTQLKPKGKLPRARHGHTMNALHKYLIVFGGQDDKHEYLDDLFIFSTIQHQWFEPIVYGDIPHPRYNHASCGFQNDQIVIFGGRTKNQRRKNQNIYILKPSEPRIALSIEECDQ